MSRNIIVITWPDSAKAYEAMTKLRNTEGDRVYQAAVVKRAEDGRITIEDGGSNTDGAATLSGGAIGSLIGILGGPLGVLLGFSTGAVLGSLFDLGDEVDEDSVVAKISSQMLPGTTSLMVDFDETDPATADVLAASTGGVLLRYNYDDTLSEIISSEAAAEAARDEAARVLREQKHAERKADLEKDWDNFKTKFKDFFSGEKAKT